MRYQARLANYPGVSVFQDKPFTVDISEATSKSIYSIDVMPVWLSELQNLTATIGEASIFSLGENVNMFGQATNVTVDFGFAGRFASYDPVFHAVIIWKGLSTENDLGVWPLKVISEYKDSDNKQYRFERSIFLDMILIETNTTLEEQIND